MAEGPWSARRSWASVCKACVWAYQSRFLVRFAQHDDSRPGEGPLAISISWSAAIPLESRRLSMVCEVVRRSEPATAAVKLGPFVLELARDHPGRGYTGIRE